MQIPLNPTCSEAVYFAFPFRETGVQQRSSCHDGSLEWMNLPLRHIVHLLVRFNIAPLALKDPIYSVELQISVKVSSKARSIFLSLMFVQLASENIMIIEHMPSQSTTWVRFISNSYIQILRHSNFLEIDGRFLLQYRMERSSFPRNWLKFWARVMAIYLLRLIHLVLLHECSVDLDVLDYFHVMETRKIFRNLL